MDIIDVWAQLPTERFIARALAFEPAALDRTRGRCAGADG